MSLNFFSFNIRKNNVNISSPTHSKAGDVLILTKPLGIQLATNTSIWLEENSENWIKLSAHLTKDDVSEMFQKALKVMTMLNRTAAQLMHKYQANAATDITGFGLLGHATNLLSFQENSVDFEINAFPFIKHVKLIAEVLGRHQKFYAGKMVETSGKIYKLSIFDIVLTPLSITGGLLISLPAENALSFCQEFKSIANSPCWVVGKVVEGTKKVIIKDNINIIEV